MMMNTRLGYVLKIIILGLISLLAGCVTIAQSPQPRFYMLKQLEDNESLKKYQGNKNVVILIGPVDMPHYLDRPQIVTLDKKLVKIAQFDRWAESLTSGLAR
ncbi:MAG TPA: ABC-type transport auxiliary lipoprotein family protein, partial [Candidatus Omnitrophota bacterium]|nr:ABC-type transport auxiliary lipoprotein family protein [Candidatus Omnitrophota bacterium]